MADCLDKVASDNTAKNFDVFGEVLAAAMVGSWKIELDEGRPQRMYVDKTMKRLLGLDENANLTPEAMYHAWFDHIDSNHYEAVKEGVKFMAGGQHAEIQYPWHHPDGRVVTIRCGGIRDASYKEGVRIVGIHQCVTNMKHVDRSLEAQQRQLEENLATERANKAKSYFFSMVSHDIRTPLNAIIGYAELLKLGIADEAERAVAVDSLLVSGHALLELINDVLDLSKLEAGKMEIIPEPVDVMRLVEEVAKAFRVSIGNKSIKITTNVKPMPWLKLDPHRVRQILFNLVGNAVKFTERGSVDIYAEYSGGRLRLQVSDTGCGISDEDQQRIAQPYVQFGSASSRGKGTGLGLAICRQLVARMGGEIELASALGQGTTFIIILPSVHEEDNERQARLSATQRIRMAVQDKVVSYKCVLIVDDQPMNRAVLKVMLKRFGIDNIITAENGKDAIAKLSSVNGIDLVLTDMWMPEMDGEALIREIRKNSKWVRIPVYAVTADVEAQKDYIAMGFSGILLKPLTLMKLKDLLG